MNLHDPSSVGRFERRDGGLIRFERLGERVRESLGGLLVADEPGKTGVSAFVRAR
jgi:hypothetical protein